MCETRTGVEYALKAIPRKRNTAIPRMVQREVTILQQLRHPNIVPFKCCMVDKTMIYIVMKYIRGGNLKVRYPILALLSSFVPLSPYFTPSISSLQLCSSPRPPSQ